MLEHRAVELMAFRRSSDRPQLMAWLLGNGWATSGVIFEAGSHPSVRSLPGRSASDRPIGAHPNRGEASDSPSDDGRRVRCHEFVQTLR